MKEILFKILHVSNLYFVNGISWVNENLNCTAENLLYNFRGEFLKNLPH